MEKPVIVGAMRTPIGCFMGTLKDKLAVDLGKVASQAAIERADIKPEQIEDVIAGMVYKVGVKGNPARQVQLNLGIPAETVEVTVEQQCSSSMREMEIASQQIMLGKSSTSLVVGMESMSRVPHFIMEARKGYRLGAKVE